jgi:hypothetical protein
MAQKKKAKELKVEDYRHEDAKRKNISSVELADHGRTFNVAEQTYFYNSHWPLVPRFERLGGAITL